MNVSKITPNMHYCGKILKQGNKYYSGSFFKTLESGKNLCLEYKNGLLKKSVLSNGEISTKIYDYDNNERLIKVNNNGKDVFVKEIKNKLGLEFRRIEIINDNIFKSYDKDDNMLFNRVLSKALSSNFFRYNSNLLGDVLKEDRYFISNLVKGGSGNYYIKVDKGCPVEPVFEWFKTIYKLKKLNHTVVLERDGNKISGLVKDSEGHSIGKLDTLLDKNNKPIWERASNDNGLSLDFKSLYTDDGLLEREMSVISLKNIKAVSDKTFDANRNVTKERFIEKTASGKGDFSYSYERKFDDNNMLIEEKKFKDIDGAKQLVCKINNEYNSQKQLTKKEYYNANDELELSEYYVYDKNNVLRLSGYNNYESGAESGYDVFDKNGNLRKRALLYEDESIEELYDKNGFLKKWIAKDTNKIVREKYKYSYDLTTGKIILTEKFDGSNIKYKANHSYSKGKESIVYKDKDDNILGKQFIYMPKDDYSDYSYIYMNAKGKRCSFEYLADILDDYDI